MYFSNCTDITGDRGSEGVGQGSQVGLHIEVQGLVIFALKVLFSWPKSGGLMTLGQVKTLHNFC